MPHELALWLLVAFVFAGLWVFWQALELTFDLIERAHERLRQAEAAESLEDAQAAKGSVT